MPARLFAVMYGVKRQDQGIGVMVIKKSGKS